VKNPRRILVAVKDPTAKALPAVDKAAQLARAFGAQIELFHGITERLSADVVLFREDGLPGAERAVRTRYCNKLEAVAQRLRATGLKVNVTAEWDFPVYAAIVRRAQRVRADLIVAECHAGRRLAPWLLHVTDWRSGLKRLLIGNTAENVLGQLGCDVLVVKPAKFTTRVSRVARGARIVATPMFPGPY
jgi:nucleotide-binding universal stress UspA family protein